ncbi:hypothetical protein [Flagellimonas flava]|uniref:Uncharacterized protein n=1 Tax=Flagellimonas flava TaxID=570519 RepID=A0A1M5KKS8_9FLAO|nr:hypothetical protein [Allomuricauda flava]SHG53079.1 hypothetical protein SAMN04488116_1629 [Allomuricauda flava]
MGIIIKHKKHLYTRLIIWSVVIGFLAFSPLIIGLVGAWISEWQTGEPCHEGNCSWMVLPWLSMFTIPVGGLIFLVFVIIAAVDISSLNNKKEAGTKSE